MECVSLETGGCDCLHPLLLLSDAISSTMLYNVLNFPAGVVPVSTVTEADEEELKLYKGCCDDPWDQTLKQVWEVVEQRLLVGVQVTVSMISGAPKYLHHYGHSAKKIPSFFIQPLLIPKSTLNIPLTFLPSCKGK